MSEYEIDLELSGTKHHINLTDKECDIIRSHKSVPRASAKAIVLAKEILGGRICSMKGKTDGQR